VAIVLDAWSRRVVGYAIGRSIDAGRALAALKATIERRRPRPGCIHHSDHGSQGGFNRSSQHFTTLSYFWKKSSNASAGIFHARVYQRLF
jgi:transposase InsO family protein